MFEDWPDFVDLTPPPFSLIDRSILKGSDPYHIELGRSLKPAFHMVQNKLKSAATFHSSSSSSSSSFNSPSSQSDNNNVGGGEGNALSKFGCTKSEELGSDIVLAHLDVNFFSILKNSSRLFFPPSLPPSP